MAGVLAQAGLLPSLAVIERPVPVDLIKVAQLRFLAIPAAGIYMVNVLKTRPHAGPYTSGSGRLSVSTSRLRPKPNLSQLTLAS
jgi:hypothetical protein